MALSGFKVAGEGMPVVMLHSSLSSSGQWQALVGRLKSDFQCINIDLLGYGEAPEVAQPEHYSLQDETDRVIDIIESQIGDRPFALVGHSFGGAVGLRLAHLMGQRLSCMALYEPVAFHLLDKSSSAYADIAKISENLPGMSAEQAARTFVDYWNHDGFFASMPSKVQRLFAAKVAKVLLDFKGLISERYSLEQCSIGHCPVMVMQGQDSPLSSRTLAQLLADGLPNAKLMSFSGGHMAPVSQSEAVAELLCAYLRETLS